MVTSEPPSRANLGEHLQLLSDELERLSSAVWAQVKDNDQLPQLYYHPHGTKQWVAEFIASLGLYLKVCTLHHPATGTTWNQIQRLKIWGFTSEALYFRRWSEIFAELEVLGSYLTGVIRGVDDSTPAESLDTNREFHTPNQEPPGQPKPPPKGDSDEGQTVDGEPHTAETEEERIPEVPTAEARAAARSAFVQPILDRLGWSWYRWAKNAHCDPKTVNRYLSGQSTHLQERQRKKLAKQLGVEPGELPL